MRVKGRVRVRNADARLEPAELFDHYTYYTSYASYTYYSHSTYYAY